MDIFLLSPVHNTYWNFTQCIFLFYFCGHLNYLYAYFSYCFYPWISKIVEMTGCSIPTWLMMIFNALVSFQRRQWHSTPVLLPGKSHGRRSLGRLQSMGSQRVGHDWATSLSLFTFMHWRRKWQPTPVFLPGEPQGRGSPMGCRLWGHTESDTTEVT